MDKFGLNYFLNQLNIVTPYGNSYLKAKQDYKSKQFMDLEAYYDTLEKFIDYVKNNSLRNYYDILMHIKDISGSIRKCKNNDVLDIVDLYEIKFQVIFLNKAKELLNKVVVLNDLDLNDLSEIIEILNPDEQISADFHIYNAYSQKLETIRKEKSLIEKEYFQSTGEQKSLIQQKRQEIVKLEQQEEYLIREELSKKLHKVIFKLEENVSRIAQIDVLVAKANLVVEHNLVRPKLSQTEINLVNATNAYIKANVEKAGNEYSSISISLKSGSTVITGANMGGKSSAIKTVLFNQGLVQKGLYVYAESATMTLFDHIEYISKDSDIVEHGLSTFGVEITSLNNVLENEKTMKQLLGFDEFASSTNPKEGRLFLKTLVNYLNKSKSVSLYSTHFDDVVNKEVTHYQVKGLDESILSKTIKAQEIHKYMNYNLELVTNEKEVPKQALVVATLLNLNEDFKQELEQNYNEE